MKSASGIFLLIWGLVIIQPSFSLFGGISAFGIYTKESKQKSRCTKMKSDRPTCKKQKSTNPVCSKKKCSKPRSSEENNSCNSQACNPSLGCSSGNFYTHFNDEITITSTFEQRAKRVIFDDNRTFQSISQCWHPPEV
jgi:hypothetical protein